ncbi:hypothetical protein LINGRAHAP2_LOCUS24917 [Linum grandiflorum]
MDVLSKILDFLNEAGVIQGFCIDKDTGLGEVTHLLYADDTILFCETSVAQIKGVLSALIVFQAITGLKVNLNKSSLSPVGQVDLEL